MPEAGLAKFVHLVAKDDGLYALDEEGVVWRFIPEKRGYWMPMPGAREETFR